MKRSRPFAAASRSSSNQRIDLLVSNIPPSSDTVAAKRVIANLRELADLTSNAAGAQRLAWSPLWRKARVWFADKVRALGLVVEADSAGNHWVTLTGKSDASLIVGSHLDSVPNGGWLDGCLGVVAGLEVLRRQVEAGI